jgi:hypothetical protein
MTRKKNTTLLPASERQQHICSQCIATTSARIQCCEFDQRSALKIVASAVRGWMLGLIKHNYTNWKAMSATNYSQHGMGLRNKLLSQCSNAATIKVPRVAFHEFFPFQITSNRLSCARYDFLKAFKSFSREWLVTFPFRLKNYRPWDRG